MPRHYDANVNSKLTTFHGNSLQQSKDKLSENQAKFYQRLYAMFRRWTQVHLSTLYQLQRLYRIEWDYNFEWWTGEDFDGRGFCLFEGIIPAFVWRGWRKSREVSDKITNLHADNLGRDLLIQYRCASHSAAIFGVGNGGKAPSSLNLCTVWRQ